MDINATIPIRGGKGSTTTTATREEVLMAAGTRGEGEDGATRMRGRKREMDEG